MLGLEENILDQVRDALVAEIGDDNKIPLTQVFEHFDGVYSFDALRCVRAEIYYQMELSEA